MELGLQDKRVLVTGSSSGIGYAAAKGFLREGAHVVIHGRSEARLAAAVARLGQELGDDARARVSTLAADLASAAGPDALIAAVPEVDVLVNNAGIFEPKAFASITDEDWLRFFEVNVMSGVRLSRHHLPRMLARNAGRILFISSESALQIPSEMIHYGTTKTAQLAVARGLAELTRGTNVTVNSILPGPTSSEGVSDFVGALAKERGVDFATMEREFFEHARPSSLIQRFATPDEVAALIVFAASAAASAINGASLKVDGGVVRSIA